MKGQFIYKIINTVNGKFYVGSTINTRERFRTHRNRLRSNRHHCKHLQAAWNKYGEKSFVFVVIETIQAEDSLQAAEDKWLAEHVGKEHCYNSGFSSEAPWRNAQPEKTPNFGRVMAEGQKEKISATLKEFYTDITNHPRFGKTHSEETKAKISEKKRANPVRYWQGKDRSEETKAKIGASQRGVKKGPRIYSPEGLARAQENMRRNAREQAPADFAAVLAKFPQEVRDHYDFSKAVYTGALNRITGVVCPDHGEVSNYAARFRKGFGCPSCGALVRAAKKKEEMLRTWATEEGRKMFIESRKNSLDTPPKPA